MYYGVSEKGVVLMYKGWIISNIMQNMISPVQALTLAAI